MSEGISDERQPEIYVVGGICKTTEELLASDTFQRVLGIFNRKNGTEYTVDEIARDYTKASDVAGFWERLKVNGEVGSIVAVQNLVKQSLAEIRSNFDLERVLSTSEMIERFKELDVDIERIYENWKEFYASRLTIKAALIKTGQLQKGAPYFLPFPQVTESEMQAFERAYHAKEVDAIMIDDARLTGWELYKLYHDERANRHIAQALPIQLCDLKEEEDDDEMPVGEDQQTLTKNDILAARQKVTETKRGVRLVAYQRDAQKKMGRGITGAYSFLDEVSGRKHQGIMDLGTYLNILEKLKDPHDTSSIHNFLDWDFYVNGKLTGTKTVSTILNNVHPNGKVLVASPGKGNTIIFSSTEPDTKLIAAFPRKTVQSEPK